MVGERPRGLLVDEVSYGYNAYSLWKTGKDEHGVAWPMVFEAFGDFKLPLYMYSLVPLVALFGLEGWVVRLPSVVAGGLLPLAVFMMMRLWGIRVLPSLGGAVVVALSPWTLMLGRFGYEAHLALMFWTISLGALIHGTKRGKRAYLIIAGILAGVTWYGYVAFRLVSAIIFLFSFIYLMRRKRFGDGAFLLGSMLITVVAILPYTLDQSGTARFRQIGLFADPGPMMFLVEQRNACRYDFPGVVCALLWNKATVYGEILLKRYVDVFSPSYLFLRGDQSLPYLHISHYGQFSFIVMPFFYIGIVVIIFNLFKKFTLSLVLLLLGLMVGVLPSLLAGEPQKVRLTVALPFILMVIGYGLSHSLSYITAARLRILFMGVFAFMIALHGFRYWVELTGLHQDKYAQSYGSHLHDVLTFADSNFPDSKLIIAPFFADPIIYYAFYNKTDPSYYQSNVKFAQRDSGGFIHAVELGEEVIVNSQQLGEIACNYNGANLLYITNMPLLKDYPETGMIYTSKSRDGIHVFAYVYNLKDKEVLVNLCEK